MKTPKLCGPHEQPIPGRDTCCSACPKGKYAASNCTSGQTECRVCEHGHFTDQENLLPRCLACRICDPRSNLVTASECKADSNRRCRCREGFYCSTAACDHCTPVTKCKVGHGVTHLHTETNDTVCGLCPSGTFNNVNDSSSHCVKHTDCEGLGLQLRVPGSIYADAQCVPRCHWLLPASLWAGFAVTLLIVVISLFIWRSKRHSAKTVQHLDTKPSVSFTSLNYPTLCHDEKYSGLPLSADPSENAEKSSDVECDGAGTPMLSISMCDTTEDPNNRWKMNHVPASLCQSEPQEDEWSEA